MPERVRLTPAIADVRRAVRNAMDAAALHAEDLVLVACSGGADSLALAAATAFEAARAGIRGKLRVGAIIVEHGLQPETVLVAERTAAVLRDLGLQPVEIVAVQVPAESPVGLEAAARDARYAALDAALTRLGASAILLGHTLDDQAETVLLGLARGSGPRSLSGMSGQRERYLRPLLGLRRATTEAFCADSGLEPWHDPHNHQEKFRRVRVRKVILPILESELGPGVAEALARTATQLRQDSDYLDGQAKAGFEAAATVTRAEAGEVELSVPQLLSQPPAIRNRVIKLALELAGGLVSSHQVEAVNELVDNWHGQKALDLAGVRVERRKDRIGLKTTKTPNQEPAE